MPEETYYIRPDEKPIASPQDFFFLRKKAMEVLVKIKDESWTDFNLHDPGITILEQLCFAITDMAYRTNFDIKDLLTNKKGFISREAHAFHPAQDILTTNPYTANDFSVLIIDAFEDIANAWVRPVADNVYQKGVKEIFNVVVCPTASTIKYDTKEQSYHWHALLEDKIRQLLVANRNINQYFENITILKPHYIRIKANISIDKTVDIEKLLAQIFHLVDTTLNPQPIFYTANELVKKEKKIEEIYNGPLLNNGIILQAELKERVKKIKAEDVAQKISALEGVIRVSHLSFIDNGKELSILHVAEGNFLLAKRTETGVYEHKDISLYINTFKVIIREEIFRLYCMHNQQTLKRTFKGHRELLNKGIKEEGTYRELSKYYSIQHFFPANYLIGAEGVLNSDTNLRKAQARQLKAYLLFFEQLLANYLSQLANLEVLYAPDMKTRNSYFAQPLYNVPAIKDILKAFNNDNEDDPYELKWESFMANERNAYALAIQSIIESEEGFLNRKNKILSHILARFNLISDTYPVALYYALYSDKQVVAKLNEQVAWKASLVKDIVPYTKYRNKAYDYLQANNEKYHFQQIIYQVLYIKNKPMQKLTAALDIFFGVQETRKNDVPGIGVVAGENTFERTKKLNVIIDDETFEDIVDDFLHEDKEMPIGNQLSFKEVDVSFFLNAVSIDFFKIAPSLSNIGASLVIYENKREGKWRIAGKFENKKTAYAGVIKVLRSFRLTSIRSEGFYLVEHVLLCPSLNTEAFGFKLLDASGNEIVKHQKWVNFQKRQQIVSSINKIMTDENTKLKMAAIQSSDYANYVDVKMHPPSFILTDTHRWEYFFKTEEENVYKEDLLNNIVTVVYPIWPARFQDQKFLAYMKQTINEYSPAHVKINFIALDITKMKIFEDSYFEWIRDLKYKHSSGRSNSSKASKLLDFISQHSAFHSDRV